MRVYCNRFGVPAWLFALVLAAACLTPAAVHAQSGQQKRPTLPAEHTTGTDHFLIHYTFKGQNAVSQKDADGDGTPDYVESLAKALEFAWQKEVVDMGWAPPPPDQGLGGDDRIDVYLEDVMADNIAGYTESTDGLVGDNPNSPQRETSAAFSYTVIDNDFNGISQQVDGETPDQLMQVTAAHEFNHVLQAGYNSTDPQTWLYEATAVWMEGQVYPDITDRVSYLPDLLDHPERCLAARQDWYGSWLYLEYLSEKFGPDVVRTIWEHSRSEDGYQAINDALKPDHTTLAATARDFDVANLLRAYQTGQSYPTVHLGGTLDGGGSYAPDVQVQSLGASYVRLTGDQNVAVQFAGPQSLSARLVGIRGGQADVFDFVDGEVDVDLRRYDDAYVIVHSDDLAASERSCPPADYALTVGRPTGQTSTPEATWPSPNFVTLGSGGSAQPATPSAGHQPYRGNTAGSSAAQTPQDLQPGFATIIPTPPDGYSFDSAYLMTQKDFGASAPFYIPDSDQSANYDFLNGSDQWISVSETPTSLATLQAWETAIDYQPTAGPQTIDGVDVLVENSGGKRSAVTATLIDQGLFIVVDGDGSRDDVLATVDSLLKNASGGGATGQPAATLAVDAPDSITATPSIFSAPGSLTGPSSSATSLPLFGVVALCGVMGCFAGIGLLAMVFFIPRRKG